MYTFIHQHKEGNPKWEASISRANTLYKRNNDIRSDRTQSFASLQRIE